jgi:hypothetical protein
MSRKIETTREPAGFPYPLQTRGSSATGCVPHADDKGPSEFRLPGASSRCSGLTFYVSVTSVAVFVACSCQTAN